MKAHNESFWEFLDQDHNGSEQLIKASEDALWNKVSAKLAQQKKQRQVVSRGIIAGIPAVILVTLFALMVPVKKASVVSLGMGSFALDVHPGDSTSIHPFTTATHSVNIISTRAQTDTSHIEGLQQTLIRSESSQQSFSEKNEATINRHVLENSATNAGYIVWKEPGLLIKDSITKLPPPNISGNEDSQQIVTTNQLILFTRQQANLKSRANTTPDSLIKPVKNIHFPLPQP